MASNHCRHVAGEHDATHVVHGLIVTAWLLLRLNGGTSEPIAASPLPIGDSLKPIAAFPEPIAGFPEPIAGIPKPIAGALDL